MPGEDHVVVKEEAERRAQGEANDVDGDVVGQRRGEPEDVVSEQKAELGDADAAGVGKEEEDGLARSVVPRASTVGPQAVGDPRVQGRGRGSDELRGVGVPGEEAEGPVLEQVEQAGVNDVGGGSDIPNWMNSRTQARSRCVRLRDEAGAAPPSTCPRVWGWVGGADGSASARGRAWQRIRARELVRHSLV